ncbi:MAG: radical SAM protein [bacterium]
MRICLINPIIQDSLADNDVLAKWPPLGIAYIAAVLERGGHEVKIIERRHLIGSLERTEKNIKSLNDLTHQQIAGFKPDIVGFTATTPLIMDACRAAKVVKSYAPSIKVVAGGPHPMALPERTLTECDALDAVCLGEGEVAMSQLAGGAPIEQIPGFVYRTSDGIIRNNTTKDIIKNLDDIPFPAWRLLDENFYFTPNPNLIRGFHLRGTSIIAARGCPFKCAFCQSPQMASLEGRNIFRFRSAANITEEIKFLRRTYGVEIILFAEDIFSLARKNIVSICEQIKKEDLNKEIKFAVNMRVDTVDAVLLEHLRSAGVVRVIYGCESGSQKTLDRINKKITVEKNYEAIRLTKEVGITCEANIMMGLPDETEEDIKKTIRFLKKTRPDRINRGKFFPLPGSRFFDEYVAKGVITIPSDWNTLYDHYVLGKFTFALMSPERLRYLQDKMDREITLPVNYIFRINANYRNQPVKALRIYILMFIHCAFLYIPIRFRNIIKWSGRAVGIRSKFIFE